jgi:hypothetical protein
MSTKHTPGPWRWEINRKHKSMQLVGGVPRFDLTVMDFDRWGMGGACIRLREDVNRMNIMHKVHERPEWIAPHTFREHHANWCADIAHPDARLIASAPLLLEALQKLVGTPEDPSNGWRGTGGTDVLFACEYCGEKHEDCTAIQHKPNCPVPFARAAILAATGGGE